MQPDVVGRQAFISDGDLQHSGSRYGRLVISCHWSVLFVCCLFVSFLLIEGCSTDICSRLEIKITYFPGSGGGGGGSWGHIHFEDTQNFCVVDFW